MSKEKLTYISEAIKQPFDEASPETTKVSLYGWDSDNLQKVRFTLNPDGSLKSQGTDFEGGQVTVGLTEVEMTFSGQTKSIQIESDVENTGFIYIGKTGVTTSTGMVQLEPGASVSMELNDASAAVYAISDTADQVVRKMALL